MAGIRDFNKQDIAAVAELWLKTYRNREPPAPEALKRYFEEIYFDNPWRDPELPCHVYEDEAGDIVGFVAAFPRLMTLEGRPIRAAVLSTIMVDPRMRGRSIGFQLMERFFAGRQDLSFTDGANGAAGKLWEAAGGDVCLLYSCQWIRILRPIGYFLERVSRRKSLRLISRILQPVASAIDAVTVRTPLSDYRLPAATAVGENATETTLLECIAEFSGQSGISPAYDLHSLTWLLREAAGATRRGQLEKVIVKDADGTRLGWYIYFARRNGSSQVLQLGGAKRTIRQVFHHLFHHARHRGALAVCGQFEPRFVSEMSDAHCRFSYEDIGVLVHSRDEAVYRAVFGGNTSLSRLDGEWWMHFSDGPWS